MSGMSTRSHSDSENGLWNVEVPSLIRISTFVMCTLVFPKLPFASWIYSLFIMLMSLKRRKNENIFLFPPLIDPEVHPQSEDYWGHVNPIGPRACYDEGKRVAETMCYAYMKQVMSQVWGLGVKPFRAPVPSDIKEWNAQKWFFPTIWINGFVNSSSHTSPILKHDSMGISSLAGNAAAWLWAAVALSPGGSPTVGDCLHFPEAPNQWTFFFNLPLSNLSIKCEFIIALILTSLGIVIYAISLFSAFLIIHCCAGLFYRECHVTDWLTHVL